jgi:hypothetical protein
MSPGLCLRQARALFSKCDSLVLRSRCRLRACYANDCEVRDNLVSLVHRLVIAVITPTSVGAIRSPRCVLRLSAVRPLVAFAFFAARLPKQRQQRPSASGVGAALRLGSTASPCFRFKAVRLQSFSVVRRRIRWSSSSLVSFASSRDLSSIPKLSRAGCLRFFRAPSSLVGPVVLALGGLDGRETLLFQDKGS